MEVKDPWTNIWKAKVSPKIHVFHLIAWNHVCKSVSQDPCLSHQNGLGSGLTGLQENFYGVGQKKRNEHIT